MKEFKEIILNDERIIYTNIEYDTTNRNKR